MRKSTKITLISLAVLLIAMAALYIGVGIYFSTHFLPGSVINGIDCSRKTVEEAEKLIAEKVQDYSITLAELDGVTETISGNQIGFEYVSDGEVEKLKDNQKPFLWIMSYFKSENYTMTAKTTYNKDMLKQAMLSLNCFDALKVTKPQDAYINETASGYTLVPEVAGNELDQDKAYTLLTEAVDRGDRSVDFSSGDCYKKPSVYSNDASLNAKLATLQKYAQMSVTYDMGNQQEVLDSVTIRQWMDVKADGTVSFDWDKASEFVASLAGKYDTIGTEEPFTTSLGEYITVLSRTYGWMINQEEELYALMDVLEQGESVTRTPIYSESAMSRGENDIGDTYVEIDYTNQRMWYYKDGQLLVDTPIVTGNVSAGMSSPEGIFCLVGKEEDATLVGEGYRTPVDYWMPFYDGVGIHDANTWRNAYGGDIYQTNGSHGCINTPTDKASIIFSNIDVGTPIVCYSSYTKQGDNTIYTGQQSTEQTDAGTGDGSQTSDGGDGSAGDSQENTDGSSGDSQENTGDGSGSATGNGEGDSGDSQEYQE